MINELDLEAKIDITQDLLAIKEVLEVFYEQDPFFRQNQYLITLYERLNQLKDFTNITDPVRNYLLDLFSRALTTTKLPILKQLKVNKELFLLLDMEKKLLAEDISNEEKIKVLKSFKEHNAVPDSATLDYLLTTSPNESLKKSIIAWFSRCISYDGYLQILQNRNIANAAVRLEALAKSVLRTDMEVKIFEKIVADDTETIENRRLCLELYNSAISVKLFQKIITDKKEDQTLRLLAIKKAIIRFDLNLDFLEKVLLEVKESSDIRKAIFETFRERIPLGIIREYFLTKEFDVAEKYEILKFFSGKFEHLNKDGTLDMVFLLMSEFAKARKLLLESGVIKENIIKKLLVNQKCAKEIKEELLNFLEKKFTKKDFIALLRDLVKNADLPINFKLNILNNFGEYLNAETLIMILGNDKEEEAFKLEILHKYQERIKKNKKVKNLETLLDNKMLSLKFLNYILKYFFKNFSDKAVTNFILRQNLADILVQKIILSLKRVQFLNSGSQIFSVIFKKNLKEEELQFLLDNFQDFFKAQDLYKLITKMAEYENYKKILEKVDLKNSSREKILEYIITDKKVKFEEKMFVLKNYFIELRSHFLSQLLTDPDIDFKLKELILDSKNKRFDLNEGGELGFILTDINEDPKIRLLIFKNYKDLLPDSIIRAVKNNPAEDAGFLEKLE